MKKGMKDLLTGIGIASIGFVAFILWDDYTRKKELERKVSAAEKRAAFIERRKAYARAGGAVRAAKGTADQSLSICPECQSSVEEHMTDTP